MDKTTLIATAHSKEFVRSDGDRGSHPHGSARRHATTRYSKLSLVPADQFRELKRVKRTGWRITWSLN